MNETITNDSALGRQYCVGHSYFTPAGRLEDTGLDTQGWWRRVVETDIRPLLEEYWFDRPERRRGGLCQQLLGGVAMQIPIRNVWLLQLFASSLYRIRRRRTRGGRRQP